MNKNKQRKIRGGKETRPAAAAASDNFHPSGKALIILTAAATVTRLLFVLIPGLLPRAWGVDFPRYIDDGIFIPILLAAPLLFLVPAIAGPADAALRRTDKLFPLGGGIWAGLAAALIIGVSAWLFPVLSALLGDGRLCLSEVLRLDRDPAGSDFFLKPSTWLTGVALHAIVRNTDFETLYEPFAWLSALSLAVVAAALAVFLRKERMPAALTIAAGVLGCGGTLFFFRYVELYHLQYGFTVAFLLSAWSYYRHGGSAWPPVVLLTAAALFGLSSAVFLPALLVLIIDGREGKQPARRALQAAALAAAGLAALFVLRESGALVSLREFVTPLSEESIVNNGIREGSTSYTLFSAARIADLFNTIYLNAGVWCLFPLLLFSQAIRKDCAARPSFRFFAVAAFGAFLLALGGNARYGMAQDWDIPAAALTAFAFLGLDMLLNGARTLQTRAGLLIPALLLFTAGHVAPWIGLNAGRASAERFSDLADMYAGSVLPWNSYRSYENLRQYHLGERNGIREFDAALRGVKTGVLRRDGYRMLTRIAGESKDSTERGAMWKALLDELLDAARKPFPADDYRHIHPDRLTESIVAALVLARNAGHGGIAGGMLEKFDAAIGDWPSLGVYYSYLRGDLDAAVRAAIMRRSLTPETEEPLLAFMAGTAYARAGDHASAVVFFERTLSLAPCEFSKAFTDLAAIYHDAYGDREKALRTLRRYRESCEFRPDDREIQDMIDRYERET